MIRPSSTAQEKVPFSLTNAQKNPRNKKLNPEPKRSHSAPQASYLFLVARLHRMRARLVLPHDVAHCDFFVICPFAAAQGSSLDLPMSFGGRTPHSLYLWMSRLTSFITADTPEYEWARRRTRGRCARKRRGGRALRAPYTLQRGRRRSTRQPGPHHAKSSTFAIDGYNSSAAHSHSRRPAADAQFPETTKHWLRHAK